MDRRSSSLALAASLAVALLALRSSPVSAQDASAPSLEAGTDAPPPFHAFAITVDPVAAYLGDYGARFEIALAPSHAIWVEPGYAGGAIEVATGYHLWLGGAGVGGVFVGPVFESALARPQDPVFAIGTGAELGVVHVWEGLTFGASASVTHRWVVADDVVPAGVAPRVRFWLGWAWR